jgi:hypothetical protein
MISDLNKRMLSIRKGLEPRHHDHLLIAWAASIPPFESTVASSKILAPGRLRSTPYIPMNDAQLDNAHELITWNLLDDDYAITSLGTAIIEYDFAIGYPFLAGEDPPESLSTWGVSSA